MRLTRLDVTNYRALRDVSIPLSRFGCLIGENNSGKSSFLSALSLFFSGTKLASNYFFDDSKPIRIAVTLEDIGDSDLALLATEHRERVSTIVRDGRLVVVRHYDTGGKATLQYRTLVPTDPRFSDEAIADLLKGQRAGQAFVATVAERFPELVGRVETSMNQDAVRQIIQEHADSLPDCQKSVADRSLPTGIDRSIASMLPSPIYIPAVKDLADDIKTTESTPFGKILSILLQAVEAKLPDAKHLFEELNSQLNRVQQLDGSITDDRLDEVKLIESTIEKFTRESFADVALRITIPPPELRTVFSSAHISVDDGVEGLIDTKGDGLRRAVVFSILRAYVELQSSLVLDPAPSQTVPQSPESARTQDNPARASYVLLFEEPELFLHPRAQRILFDALRVFASQHHVLVTTHSPMFLGPAATETFVKLRKVRDDSVADRPFTTVHTVDLSDVNSRDQFQIICFENNNAAFFADTIVLVEGDSDLFLLPHIARTIDPAWDVARAPVVFARISGKGNIRRYRQFFNRFGVRVPVIADLDLLVNGFEMVEPDSALRAARDKLLARADELIEAESEEDGQSARDASDAHQSGELRGLWRRVKQSCTGYTNGTCTLDDLNQSVDAFFGWQRRSDRLLVLKQSDDPQVLRLKWHVLDSLRAGDVYVLERGAIEDYYPDDIIGVDKLSRAQNYCASITSREAILDCCGEQELERNGEVVKAKEFELIFRGIFRGQQPRI